MSCSGEPEILIKFILKANMKKETTVLNAICVGYRRNCAPDLCGTDKTHNTALSIFIGIYLRFMLPHVLFGVRKSEHLEHYMERPLISPPFVIGSKSGRKQILYP